MPEVEDHGLTFLHGDGACTFVGADDVGHTIVRARALCTFIDGSCLHLLAQGRQRGDVTSGESIDLAVEIHILNNAVPSTVIVSSSRPVGSQASIVDFAVVDISQFQGSALGRQPAKVADNSIFGAVGIADEQLGQETQLGRTVCAVHNATCPPARCDDGTDGVLAFSQQ